MATHDLIVMGASAGGVEAISTVLAGLPRDLPAAVCVVVHLRPDLESRMPEVLRRASTLPVEAATNGAPLRLGTIHVAVPDLHLVIELEDDTPVLRVLHGPRENRARPAVDPLFRSAAFAYGPRAIGVILSGALDDGTAGLWAIKHHGGITVVQDPADATVGSMPAHALAEVGADHVATALELGPLLARLVHEPVRDPVPAERVASRRRTG
jgi:two-component system, chemotaxis family, protein-glutamate methylesterase/glutaminase